MKTRTERGDAKGFARLWRRLRSARGSAYLEFSVLVPFFLFAYLFAADFTRTLYCEQQVEIATRVLCDVESHQQVPDDAKRPSAAAKRVVRYYLAEALAKEGLYSYGGSTQNSVYCMGSTYRQEGPVHSAANWIIDVLNGQGMGNNEFLKILGKILGGAIDVLTLRTFRYITEVFPTDRVVKTSVSVLIQPVFPLAGYTLFGRHDSKHIMLIPSVTPSLGGNKSAYDRPLLTDQRERYYCHMPSMNTAPLAPPTLVRKILKIFPKSWTGQ